MSWAQPARPLAAAEAGIADRAWPEAARLVHPASLCASAAAARRAAALSRDRAAVRRRDGTFTGVLDAVDAHAAQLESVKSLFDQSWFPSLDAAVAYALVRERKPQHIIEVGSGHSTRVLSKALGGLGEIIAVDPAPRADIIDLPACASCPRPCRRHPPTCSTC
jgi:hypothetical protein